MPDLLDMLDELEEKKSIQEKILLEKKVLRKKPKVAKAATAALAKRRISTDRNLNKEQLVKRIIENMSNNIDSIPIEVLRTKDLEFRIINER